MLNFAQKALKIRTYLQENFLDGSLFQQTCRSRLQLHQKQTPPKRISCMVSTRQLFSEFQQIFYEISFESSNADADADIFKCPLLSFKRSENTSSATTLLMIKHSNNFQRSLKFGIKKSNHLNCFCPNCFRQKAEISS